ncbi:GntR family transcriptional regulator [uncultured Agrococcus sp.]|uniref:GntR family transcriptional regulator n=1 Tax=uncultured Agrococcus sp. TaxID=382258 RepID=UPI0025F42F49|nr:GntR family transcriptional regulator [uncultured Agrococcus sp.]
MIDDSRPLFMQIADRIAEGILDDTYPEDTAVPSTNELAKHLRINPATAGKGLTLLVEQGVLVKRRGIGMFVAVGARDLLVRDRSESFAAEFIAPMIHAAKQLGLSREELITAIEKELS